MIMGYWNLNFSRLLRYWSLTWKIMWEGVCCHPTLTSNDWTIWEGGHFYELCCRQFNHASKKEVSGNFYKKKKLIFNVERRLCKSIFSSKRVSTNLFSQVMIIFAKEVLWVFCHLERLFYAHRTSVAAYRLAYNITTDMSLHT